MRVEKDGFSFDFTDASNAFVFDEKDKSKPTFHGQPMKAVDLVAEFDEADVYVEIKDPYDREAYQAELREGEDADEVRAKLDKFAFLKSYLKYKYRDSYLFRHAEKKVKKPIHYICLLTFDNALNNAMSKSLRRELPVGISSDRWKREIAHNCQVVNLDKWNENFPKWPVQKIKSKV